MLRYLPTNMTRREIAAELSVSVNTVSSHSNMYAKLGADDRSAAIRHAREMRLLAASRSSAAATGTTTRSVGKSMSSERLAASPPPHTLTSVRGEREACWRRWPAEYPVTAWLARAAGEQQPQLLAARRSLSHERH